MTIKEQAQQNIQKRLEEKRVEQVEVFLNGIKDKERRISELRKEVSEIEGKIEEIEKISLSEFEKKYSDGCITISSNGWMTSYPYTFTSTSSS
jgi:peptidoglycan hydrolase CwlO-like protein